MNAGSIAAPPMSATPPGGADALARLMAMVSEETGIQLPDGKRAMVAGRLAKRLRQLHCDVDQYLAKVRKDTAEFTILVDLAVTNHTAWWREGAHFDDFRSRVVAPAAAARSPRLRVWTAACSTGEEAWTLAACVYERMRTVAGADTQILATDISTRALARARAGVYVEDALRNVPPVLRDLAVTHYARPAADRSAARSVPGLAPPSNPLGHLGDDKPLVQVRQDLRALVHFARLNLMGDWPMRGPFDAVFCRNVMIYFDPPTQRRLVRRLVSLLRPGGVLYVGLAESLAGCGLELRALQPSVYQVP